MEKERTMTQDEMEAEIEHLQSQNSRLVRRGNTLYYAYCALSAATTGLGAWLQYKPMPGVPVIAWFLAAGFGMWLTGRSLQFALSGN